jgi:hypothetical protein
MNISVVSKNTLPIVSRMPTSKLYISILMNELNGWMDACMHVLSGLVEYVMCVSSISRSKDDCTVCSQNMLCIVAFY